MSTMSEPNDPGNEVSTSCYFCGDTLSAGDYNSLNELLVEHGREKHEYELENERDREGTYDPIAVSDLIRSGPDE